MGGLMTHIHNSYSFPINITFYQTIPWYLRLQFHTLKADINGNEINIIDCM
jgi:hypothetical protein